MTDMLDDMKQQDNLRHIKWCQQEVMIFLQGIPSYKHRINASGRFIVELFEIIDSYERDMKDDAMERINKLIEELDA